jgi:hypothetical protein
MSFAPRRASPQGQVTDPARWQAGGNMAPHFIV